MFFNLLIKSFANAFRGIGYTFRHEVSFRIQIVFAIVVLIGAFYLPLRTLERVVIILLVAMVLILELANSVLERVVDLFQPKIDYIAKAVKDIMAAAVFVAALASVVVGLIIFVPYLKFLI
ncbi:MAG: diacylglycerol kinase family protein [Patescibacteria group bacterium]|nr:diacylglycerol kinase family protein [Patescibacteria group bacterium]